MAVITILLAMVGVYASLPKSGSGWVIYNCSREHVCKSFLAALDKIGVEYELCGSDLIRLPKEEVELQFSGLPLLRNTTVSVCAEKIDPELIRQIETAVDWRLSRVECTLNPSGPAMLVAGTTMLILPLLMMVQHMDAFVRVVSDLLPL